MSIKLRCYCGQTFRAPDNRLGRRVRCPRCERIVRILDSRSSARKESPAPPAATTVTVVQAVLPESAPSTSPLPPAEDPRRAIEPHDAAFPAIAANAVQRPLVSDSLADLLEEELLARERNEGPAAIKTKALPAAKFRQHANQRGWFEFYRAKWFYAWLGAVVVAILLSATSREGFKLVVLTAFAANLICPTIVVCASIFQWARTMMFPDVDLLWYFLVPFYQPIKVWQHRHEMPISTRILCFAALFWITSAAFLGLAMTSPMMPSFSKDILGL